MSTTTLKINGESFVMNYETAKISAIKKVVRSYANATNTPTKDLRITMPDGRNLSFGQLNILKEVVVRLNIATYAGEGHDAADLKIKELDWLHEQACNTLVPFSHIGSSNQNFVKNISELTTGRLIESRKITDDFTTRLIEE